MSKAMNAPARGVTPSQPTGGLTPPTSRGEIMPTGQAGPPSLVDNTMLSLARAIDDNATNAAMQIEAAKGRIERGLLMGAAMTSLRNSINEKVLEHVMPLMGSPNGFGSDRPNDRDNRPYPVDVVRDALVTSLLLGFYPVGNEWMIYSGKCLGLKNGWKRKLEEVPGISDIKSSPGSVIDKDGKKFVRAAMSWKINGVPNQLSDGEGKPGRVFTINSYGKERDSTIIGKAEAQAYKAAYVMSTGSVCTFEPEEDHVPALSGPATAPPPRGTVAVLDRLAAANGEGAAKVASTPEPGAPAAQNLIGRIQDALHRSGMGEPDWVDLSERLNVPVEFQRLTHEEAGRVLEELERESS